VNPTLSALFRFRRHQTPPKVEETLFRLERRAIPRALELHTPSAIRGPSVAYMEARMLFEEGLEPAQLAVFRALQSTLEEIRRWELVYGGRGFFLAGYVLGKGERPDAPAIARALADEASRSVEDQAYSLRSLEEGRCHVNRPSFLTAWL